jgi:hypothetical protein
VLAAGFGSEIPMIHPEFTHYEPHMIVGAVLTVLGWVGKYVGGLLMDEWRDAKSTLNSIKQTAEVQSENHLTTIQGNTAKTNEILERMASGQAEMNGWLKGRLQ